MNQNKFNSDVVIGLEIHVELATETKLFCSCPTYSKTEEDLPNTRVCPICLGHPGSKPVLNKKAVDYALKLCLALNSKIAKTLVFSRKSYFYPDLAKNYQITQYESPVGTGGAIVLSTEKKVNLERVHIEEDPASLVHPGTMRNSEFVLVDYNRSGDPLCEIVTKPELESPEEARDFMKQLISILVYLDIFDPKRCIIKADANVSIKETNYTRAEIKNITGFKEIEKALEYEIERQKKDFKEGKRIIQETRGWDSDNGVTFSMRTKESEADYGYIYDPDLVPIDIDEEWISSMKKQLPELPLEKSKRFQKEYKISKEDSVVLASDKDLAEMFDEAVKKVDASLAVRWCRRELTRVLNFNKMELQDSKMKKEQFIELLELINSKTITENVGKEILNKLIVEPFSPKEYVKENNLESVSDVNVLESVCKEVIDENKKAVDDYLSGNEKSLHYLIGQVMRKTRGTATPNEVNALLKKILNSSKQML